VVHHPGTRKQRVSKLPSGSIRLVLVNRTVFYIRALSLVFYVVFLAAAVVASSSSHPHWADAFGIAAVMCMVMASMGPKAA
jgi:hypothetical protein